MLALGLAASLLAGMGSTHGLGEQSPFPVVVGDARLGPVGVEGLWSDANKYTGEGWIGRGAADLHLGPAFAGGAYTHRDGGPWSKDVAWGRGGLDLGALKLLYEQAINSPNKEKKIEARLRLSSGGRFVIEPRFFYEKHSQGDGYGASILGGFQWGRKK